MRFSIVTPVYNAVKYLPEMLASVKEQTFTDWELIIVDDASTDGSREIIEKLASSDKRIKPVFRKENSGSDFRPRRTAIELSTGEFIVNIDADDFVDKDYLRAIDSVLSRTEADLAYGDMYIVREGKRPERYVTANDETYGSVTRGHDIFHMSLDCWKVSGVAATSRRVALASLAFYDREFKESSWHPTRFDNETLSRIDLYLAEKVTFAKASYYYRIVPGSVTHTQDTRRFDLLDADIQLAGFTGRHYGINSEEYRLAHRQLFHHVIESIRAIKRNPDLKAGEERVRHAFSSIDYRAVRKIVSPRYWSLMQLGYPFSKFILGIYGGREG